MDVKGNIISALMNHFKKREAINKNPERIRTLLPPQLPDPNRI